MTEVFLSVARLVVAATFIWAGLGKMRRWAEFFRATRDLLPASVRFGANIAAALVPPLELALAILILDDGALAPALLASTGLLFSFLVVLVRAYRLRLQSSCACFGAGEESIGPVSVVRAGSLLLLSLTALVLTLAGTSTDALFSASALIVSALLVASALAGGAALRLVTVVEAEIRSKG